MSLQRQEVKERPCSHNESGFLDSNILEISENPDFYIFTTLVWCWHNRNEVCPVKRVKSHDDENGVTVDHQSQPDLGLLSLHKDRLCSAATALNWQVVSASLSSHNSLQSLKSHILNHVQGLPEPPKGHVDRLKLRVTISKKGVVSVDSVSMEISSDHELGTKPFIPTSLELSHRQGRICQVYVDAQPTQPSLFTTHKTSQRSDYDAARARGKITSASPIEKEVLLYNTSGEITEASLCTAYFNRDGTWLTPAATCGGLLGVTRRLALENRLCKEGLIHRSSIKDGEVIWLSNGARGFFIGQVCPCP